MTHNELAARIERAEGPDRALFCHAFKLVFPEVSAGAWDAIDEWDAAYDRFCALLDAGGFFDAAMLLLPDDVFPSICFVTKRVWLRDANNYDLIAAPAWGYAHTVPASIVAAAIRARSAS